MKGCSSGEAAVAEGNGMVHTVFSAAADIANVLLVVIDRDPTRIPAAEIQQARIRATWVGGQARYES